MKADYSWMSAERIKRTGTRVMLSEAYLRERCAENRWAARGEVVGEVEGVARPTLLVRWDGEVEASLVSPDVLTFEDWARRTRRAAEFGWSSLYPEPAGATSATIPCPPPSELEVAS